jgi:predicted dehydrogenase
MTIGLIGTGWGVRVQVPVFRSVGLDVTALAGRDAAKTQKIAGDLNIKLATADWREVLQSPDVRIVSIVTPPNTHAEMAIAALEAGKHVLCEKPTAMDAAEAQRMLDAANAHPDQLALIDHELRFAPAVLKLRSLLREGAIGTLRYANLTLMGAGRRDPNRAWNWWSDAAQGGGLLGAIGSHQIDTFRFVMGSEVVNVSALLHTFVKDRPDADGSRQPVTADDYYQLRLNFANGVLASAESNLTNPIDEPNALTIYGTEGALRWQEGKLHQAGIGQTFTDITPPHTYDALPGLGGDFPHATIYLAHALKAYLAGDKTTLTDAATFHDGLIIQKVLDAARRSHDAGGATQPV